MHLVELRTFNHLYKVAMVCLVPLAGLYLGMTNPSSVILSLSTRRLATLAFTLDERRILLTAFMFEHSATNFTPCLYNY
jgi:hypothetical protein